MSFSDSCKVSSTWKRLLLRVLLLSPHRFTGRSRLWKIVFDRIMDPLRGGTITAVVEGSELPVGGTPKMMDNM